MAEVSVESLLKISGQSLNARFNAELIVMRGPLFAGSDNPLFGAILTPHKRDVA